jgi:cell wall-associated NlpC family hydrolase
MQSLDISSVDCSAMINLSYIAHGLQIPRMSREQFLDCEEIMHGKDLQPGDLIFFASIYKHPFRIDHVMLYTGNEQLIEATFSGEHKVRMISFKDRVGQDLADVTSGDIIDSDGDLYHIYFGTFFKKLQELRDNALRYSYGEFEQLTLRLMQE